MVRKKWAILQMKIRRLKIPKGTKYVSTKLDGAGTKIGEARWC